MYICSYIQLIIINILYLLSWGGGGEHAVAQLVEALRYKPV